MHWSFSWKKIIKNTYNYYNYQNKSLIFHTKKKKKRKRKRKEAVNNYNYQNYQISYSIQMRVF